MFNKMLMLNYKEADLEQPYWNRIDKISAAKVLISADDPSVATHLVDTDCLVVKLGMAVDRTMMDKAPSLKYIGVLGTGFGRIDVNYASQRGITVCNVAGYSTESVAEFGIGVLLQFFRDLSRAQEEGRKGNYSEASFMGTDLRNKSVGIIGLGRIGGRFAELLARGFGADTRYWNRTRRQVDEGVGTRYQEVEDLLREADIVSLHLAYNPATEGFLSSTRLQLIKPGAILLNLSPMELVNFDALEQRLEKGDITLIIDHADELTDQQAQALSRHPNCIMYPPIANITSEASAARQDVFVGNLENFLARSPTNKVN